MSERAKGDEAIMDFVARKQPLDGGRIGVPEDLDAAVVYFLSEGSRFVTGQVLAVDGGWTVTEGVSRDRVLCARITQREERCVGRGWGVTRIEGVRGGKEVWAVGEG